MYTSEPNLLLIIVPPVIITSATIKPNYTPALYQTELHFSALYYTEEISITQTNTKLYYTVLHYSEQPYTAYRSYSPALYYSAHI